MGKDYFIECLNEIPFEISSSAKRLILWAEKTSKKIFLVLRVESMNGTWEKKTAEREEDITSFIAQTRCKLVNGIMVKKFLKKESPTAHFETSEKVIWEDNKNKIEWSWGN